MRSFLFIDLLLFQQRVAPKYEYSHLFTDLRISDIVTSLLLRSLRSKRYRCSSHFAHALLSPLPNYFSNIFSLFWRKKVRKAFRYKCGDNRRAKAVYTREAKVQRRRLQVILLTKGGLRFVGKRVLWGN